MLSIGCCLHRQALAAKHMSETIKLVLSEVKMVNFIKARPLNAKIFSLCEDMESNHETLLVDTEMRWLSRGKVLARFFKV